MVAGAVISAGGLLGSLGLKQGLKATAPGAASVGMAGLAAAAFGYNYGYHVRRGYHDFKPSKSKTTSDNIASIDPNKQNAGLGMMAAEQRTTPEPSIANQANTVAAPNDPWVYSQKSGVDRIKKSQIKTHEQYVNYVKYGKYPKKVNAGFFGLWS